jgi:hypothetical protein
VISTLFRAMNIKITDRANAKSCRLNDPRIPAAVRAIHGAIGTARRLPATTSSIDLTPLSR